VHVSPAIFSRLADVNSNENEIDSHLMVKLWQAERTGEARVHAAVQNGAERAGTPSVAVEDMHSLVVVLEDPKECVSVVKEQMGVAVGVGNWMAGEDAR
jgi:3-hydroxyisobutyrate dehydrogenase-like beta-hydroxyacid dehydrogenase